jgi:hypothetical protein
MASERHIYQWIATVRAFIDEKSNHKEKAATDAIINLAATIIVDIHRIADAMEAQVRDD